MNQHKLLHMTLSKSLKLLIEDFNLHGNRLLGSISIQDLLEWAEREADRPTEPKIEG